MKKLDESGKKNLYKLFGEIEDFRRAQGRMHSLPFVLIIITMAIMSGFPGRRAVGDFIKRHSAELIELFKPKNDKLPSFQTVARVISGIKFDDLIKIFYKWTLSYVDIKEKEWFSIDGKAIGGTVTNPHDKLQEYINLVSVFSSKRKQVIALKKVKDKGSEIPIVQDLIEQLDLKGVIFTADALHCQKDTVKKIIKSENDYVIGVKGNQKNLLKQIKKTSKKAKQ